MSMLCTAILLRHILRTGLSLTVEFILSITLTVLVLTVCLLAIPIFLISHVVIMGMIFARFTRLAKDACLLRLTSHLVR